MASCLGQLSSQAQLQTANVASVVVILLCFKEKTSLALQHASLFSQKCKSQFMNKACVFLVSL